MYLQLPSIVVGPQTRPMASKGLQEGPPYWKLSPRSRLSSFYPQVFASKKARCLLDREFSRGRHSYLEHLTQAKYRFQTPHAPGDALSLHQHGARTSSRIPRVHRAAQGDEEACIGRAQVSADTGGRDAEKGHLPLCSRLGCGRPRAPAPCTHPVCGRPRAPGPLFPPTHPLSHYTLHKKKSFFLAKTLSFSLPSVQRSD